jgi:ferric-dicitrate binding protein FerR (iron transport regulator)
MDPSKTRFRYLLQQYAERKAGAEELEELAALLEENWERQELGRLAPHVDWAKMLRDIVAEGNKSAPVRSLPVWRRWVAVAAVVFCLVAGGYLWRHARRSESVTQQRHPAPGDVLPGGNKAILTLAGGRQIILDSAHQGSLAVQGTMQIVKTDSGKLVYSASPSGTGQGSAGEGVVYNTLSTPRGGQYQLTLPDGTHVWLNAASSITYPTAFVGEERKVTITGEAYLEVTKQARQPFIVEVAGATIEVLGTSFNVNAYPDEASINTTLLEGRVRVIADKRKGVLLGPGQQAQVTATDNKIVEPADVAAIVAWKNGLFDFTKADLPTVLRQLARWYDVDVVYKGVIQPRQFWGKMQRDLNLSEVLAILQQTNVHFTIDGKKLLVTP